MSDNAEAVYEAVRKMAEEHSLKFDADGIRDTVETMSRQISVSLADADIVQVCEEILPNQKPDTTVDAPSPA